MKTHITYTNKTSTKVTVEDYEKYITSFEYYWKELIGINKDLYDDFKPISFLPYSSDVKIGVVESAGPISARRLPSR